MLNLVDRSLFMFAIPAYDQFKAKSVGIKNTATAQGQANNIHGLTYMQMYELAMEDIEPDNTVLISTTERYNSYVKWLIKNKPSQDLNIRLSKKKLATISLREQLIILIRRFHPWKEDLDKFILRIEECGFLEAWGSTPLLGDVSINPNLKKYRDAEESELKINMFMTFIQFLAIGLGLGLITFMVEKLSPSLERKYGKVSQMMTYPKKQMSFTAGICLCLIPMIIATHYFFKEEERFPAVAGKSLPAKHH